MNQPARPVFAIALVVVASAFLAAGLASAADAPLRLVSVSGGGEVKAQPDMAYVTIGVEARKPTVNEAGRR